MQLRPAWVDGLAHATKQKKIYFGLYNYILRNELGQKKILKFDPFESRQWHD
jgi:hypothetical protein